MDQILDRYERYSYAERQLVEPDIESQVLAWNKTPRILLYHETAAFLNDWYGLLVTLYVIHIYIYHAQCNWTFEYSRLKAKVELLQRNQRYYLVLQLQKHAHFVFLCMFLLITWTSMGRHYLGEDLDSLTLKEIQSLEHQLETALKQIRSRKVLN